jgi:predicted dehydrogenase
LKWQTSRNWRDHPELAGGGAFFEGGIHWVNFMAHMGLTVQDAHGYQPPAARGMDRTTVAVFEYREGAIGTLLYSWEIGSPLKGLRLSSIYGTEGAVTFESNGLFLAVRGRRLGVTCPEPTDLLGYRSMFEDFFGALRDGRPAAFELADARSDLLLVERIYQTAARGDETSPRSSEPSAEGFSR